MPQIRIDKFIADRTEYSRSQVKQLVKKGQIKVDGIPVKSSDAKINPEQNTVSVEDRELSYRKNTYILLNKPEGYV